jgi:hypothetical protein
MQSGFNFISITSFRGDYTTTGQKPTREGTMSKKLRNLKQKTRSAAKGGRNGQIFERFVNAHNARVQSPSATMEETGAAFAEGFRQGVRSTINREGG